MFALLVALTLSAPPHGEPVTVLGRMTEQGQKLCKKDWQVEWVDRHMQVGFVRVIGELKKLKKHQGRLLMLEGTVDTQFPIQAVTHQAECPIPQMRSDWVEGYQGTRVRRNASLPFAMIRMTRATPVQLTAKSEGKTIDVSFTNPLKTPMTGLTVTIHHEGCYRKPGSTSASKTFKTVKPGETVTMTAPRIIDSQQTRRRGHHAARAVTLQASHANSVYLDVDVPLRDLGVIVPCPNRR